MRVDNFILSLFNAAIKPSNDRIVEVSRNTQHHVNMKYLDLQIN